MHKPVREHRHFALGSLFANFGQVPALRVGCIGAPFGEVERTTTSIYVRDHKPGNGSQLTIPRPNRVIGMAVVARPTEYRSNGQFHGRTSVDFHSRISP